MMRQNCNGTVSDGTDIKLQYMTASQWNAVHTTNAGGENHSVLASSSWCNLWSMNYPCGSH